MCYTTVGMLNNTIAQRNKRAAENDNAKIKHADDQVDAGSIFKIARYDDQDSSNTRVDLFISEVMGVTEKALTTASRPVPAPGPVTSSTRLETIVAPPIIGSSRVARMLSQERSSQVWVTAVAPSTSAAAMIAGRSSIGTSASRRVSGDQTTLADRDANLAR